MAIEKVRKHLEQFGRAADILEFESSSATVELAAKLLNVDPAEIGKTLSFRDGDSALLVVASGDAKVDNAKFKNTFGFKARMLNAEEVLNFTGHEVGGVCPFGIEKPIKIYLDASIQRFDFIYPGCGSHNAMIKLSIKEMWEYANALDWVDVCKLPT